LNPTRAVALAAYVLFPECTGLELGAVAGVNPRTARRVLAAANRGEEVAAARGVAAAMHERLTAALAYLEPFKGEG
jgi:hypothetical protein